MQLKKLNGLKTVKEKILAVLSAEKKLSLTNIHLHLLEQFGGSVSYQAVHKALNDLESNGIVLKNENLFELNMSWIKQLKEYASTVESPAPNLVSKINSNTDFSKPVEIQFNDISQICIAVAQAFADKEFTKGVSSPVYSILRHAWWPFRFNFKDFFLLKRFLDVNPGSRNTILENSPFDQWIWGQYFTAISDQLWAGSGTRIGINWEYPGCDFFVQGDIVLQVYFSEETNKLLDQVYSKIGNITDLFAFYVANYNRPLKVDIKLLIYKNPAIASMIKAKIDTLFDGDNENAN